MSADPQQFEIQWKVKGGDPNYNFLPPKDKCWTRFCVVTFPGDKGKPTPARASAKMIIDALNKTEPHTEYRLKV